ncbi:MAG: hypothetical protein GY751_01515 [Bacteroidetes bacterium]|nr:hypothetical protein [Bacteroidota bacterium]
MKRLIICVFILMGLTTITWAAGEVEASVTESENGFLCEKYGPDSIKSIQYYSLYREYFKQENYNAAMEYWPYVYKNAPMLNSRVINNGIEYYTLRVEESVNPEDLDQFNVYLDSLLMLYDHKAHCHGDAVKNLARKGNLMLKYRSDDKGAVRDVFGECIDKGGEQTPYYVLENYFRILLNDLDKEMITPDEVLAVKDNIEMIVNANTEDAKYGPKYEKVMINIETLFESNKKVQQLFDCVAMKPTWEVQYRTDPNNVQFVNDVYRKMNHTKCKSDPFTEELKMALIRLDPTPKRMMVMASHNIKAKDYSGAIDYINKAIELETNPNKKAEYNYKIAELKYAKKDFSGARTYAKKAIADRPDWGKPYLLIGKLYASSGKLCGPGTGLESQRVIWPAMDYFYKAKSVDSSVSTEAQQLINKYYAYLPEKSDIFMQWGKGDGDSYFVPCWIQENTTIRTK